MGAIWSGASGVLLTVLEFFYGITHSYGLAIILLTLVVRVILYPLNQKQLLSMQKMQKVQPMMKVIQEKYANDKQKMQQETMRLYKEYQINPAAGCLPLLVQLPILILLFNVLRTYDFAGTNFLGVLLGSSVTAGLSQALGLAKGASGQYSIFSVIGALFSNPGALAHTELYLGNLILLIGIALLTWAQQKLSGGNNPQMATMNTIMPFFMAFICLSIPGGVMLYWGLSSLIGVVQQYFVMKKTAAQMAIKPNLHKNKPVQSASGSDDDDDDEDDDEEEEEED